MGKRQVRLDVHYELGHTYQERWDRTRLHCPQCGLTEVWVEFGEGDYYAGPSHLCVACGASFNLPGGCRTRTTDWQDQQRLAAFRGEPCPPRPTTAKQVPA
jgi:transposase-like protein